MYLNAENKEFFHGAWNLKSISKGDYFTCRTYLGVQSLQL